MLGGVFIKKYNKEKGDEGESIACNYLINNNYRILERNFKTNLGEIDIIAKKDKCICFIEVKLRNYSYYGKGVEAVNYAKQKHIVNVAKQYILFNKIKNIEIRFDVIELTRYNGRFYGKHYKKMIG